MRRPERVSHIYIFIYPYSDEVVFFRLYFGVKKERAACVFVYISTDEFLALANDDEGWKPDGWSRGKRPTEAAPSRRRELLRRDGKKEVAGVEKKRNIYNIYIYTSRSFAFPHFFLFFFSLKIRLRQWPCSAQNARETNGYRVKINVYKKKNIKNNEHPRVN